MEFNYMTGALEAILFASGEPIEREKLAQTLETDVRTLDAAVDGLNEYYSDNQRGFEILKLDTCFQMTTRAFYGEITRRALDHRRNTPLSNAAMEILAVIAYNQPVTKGYIEQIRGVDCFYGINSLIEKGLVEERGRLDAPGRPHLYGTTADFLRCFGLESLDDLPRLSGIELPEGEQASAAVPDDAQQVLPI
ncbi:MAG: SMC-Scp complex subunit ScpB [Clostridia bacterium]|nr:SMC-Scp complex subunit ScpB [Clostridia bacterium]